MAKRATDPWSRLWAGVLELEEVFEHRLVFIGGVAVYIHVKAEPLPGSFIEVSHDGDLYVSLADFADLRGYEDVTQNQRLNKHQFIKDGVEFDVYVEHHNSLVLPYIAVAQESSVIGGVRVACLEHLLLLKLEAYSDRRGSAKGRKDERDLIRLGYLLARRGVVPKRLKPYLTADHVVMLEAVQRSAEFLNLCRRNAHQAQKLRAVFKRAAAAVAKAIQRPRRRP